MMIILTILTLRRAKSLSSAILTSPISMISTAEVSLADVSPAVSVSEVSLAVSDRTEVPPVSLS